MAITLWSLDGRRDIALCTDSKKVLRWAEHANPHPPVACRILLALHRYFLVDMVGISPVYVRSENNRFAAGIARLAARELTEWANRENMDRVDAITQLFAGIPSHMARM